MTKLYGITVQQGMITRATQEKIEMAEKIKAGQAIERKIKEE